MCNAMKTRKLRNSDKRQSGYTLIEMAIVVTVVGLIMASFISAYGIYQKTKAQQDTENNASLLTAALGNFLVQYGRYPCPARLDLARGDARYGLETECNPLVTAPAAPLPAYPAPATAGTYSNGLYFENGVSFVDVNPSPANVCLPAGPAVAGSCVIPKIRRGAIPFRSLGLPEEQSQDGWGNRFQYAVTENLAVTTSYVRRSGGIVVYDRNQAAAGAIQLTRTDNRAHYILFSSGPDRLGAFSSAGQLMRPCGATGYDRENCNTSVANALAYYSSGAYAPNVNSAEHFDDYVQFFSSVETPLWRVSDDGGFHIRDLIDAESGGQIGIGLDTPATNATMDVAGEVRAADSNALASEVCDPSRSNCIPVSKFGSETDDFKCPANTYARSFGQRTNPSGDPTLDPGAKYIKCVPSSPTTCAPGEIMTGVEITSDYPKGKPKCSTAVACAAQTFTACSSTPAVTTYTVPAQLQNTTWTTPVIGSSWQRTYVCNTVSGVTQWRTQSTTGNCVCNAVDEYVDQSCNSYKNNGNWTGVVTFHNWNYCPANSGGRLETANSCVCAPLTETRTTTCPIAGYAGAVTQQRQWICDSATAGHYTAWGDVSSTCTCAPSTQNQTLSCGTGYTGSILQHRDFNCGSGSWGGWITDSNTCSCAPGQTENRSIGCTAPLTGSIDQTRVFNCATSSWGAWTDVANSCVCSGATENRVTACTGAHITGNRNERRTYNCPTSTWGAWTEISNTCSCVADVEFQTVACTAPLLGNITQQRTYNCGTASWGPWVEAANNCGAVAYTWVSKTAATGPFGAPLAVQQGSSCSSVGASSSCSSPAGGGQYWHYATCQCE